MQPDTDTLRLLIDMRGLTPERTAELIAVDARTVWRWLRGKSVPQASQRTRLAQALAVPLGLLVLVVWPQTPVSEEERAVNRRILLQAVAGASGVAAASLLPGWAPLEVSAGVSQLVARFATADPATMLAEAVSLLDTVLETLDGRLSPEERDRLLSDAVDTASVAAWSATLSHRRAEAAAYFVLAREYADHSEDPFLKGAALASSARLDRPIAGNRPNLARRKLSVAIPLLGDSMHAQWATFMQAEAYAALNRPRECFAALERAHGMVPFDSGRGFFSSAGLLLDVSTVFAHDQWSGLCYAHLGQADRAVAHTNRALRVKRPYSTEVVAANSNAALAYTVAGEPEAACAHAVRALTGAQETGYRAGIVRVRRVRARMQPGWDPLACVQDLDERLRLAPWN